VVELRVSAPKLVVAPSERPVASPLARRQVESTRTVTNLRHEPVELPELPCRMLMLLDGTRDFEALVADIVKLAQDGKIGVQEQQNGPVVVATAHVNPSWHGDSDTLSQSSSFSQKSVHRSAYSLSAGGPISTRQAFS
jgi:hypothetical protein